MGTVHATLCTASCCGLNNTPERVQSDISTEEKSPVIRYNKTKNQTKDKAGDDKIKPTVDENTSEQKIELKSLMNVASDPQPYESKRTSYKMTRKQAKSVDFCGTMPKPIEIVNRQARSYSHSLSAKHRYRINLKKRSSILIRRAKKDFTLPFRINQICTIFLNYITENDLNEKEEMDLFGIEISYSQLNIVLNNHQIEISPDMIAALVWELLDINGMINNEIKGLGLEKDNSHNDPMKERSFHQKQFKLISKCRITYKMIETLMKQLNNHKIITSWDKIAAAKNLTYKRRNFVIWDKIFKNLLNGTTFNVENDYLYGVLGEEDLNNLHGIIGILSSLESHWKHRIQIMKFIDNKIRAENNIFTNEIDNDKFIKLLAGWSIQLLDPRSAVSFTAIALLPTILSSLLLLISYPIVLFDVENIMQPMFNGIFVLIKNKRMKDLSEDSYQSFIQIIDIFTEIAIDLEDYELLKMVIEMLMEHSNQSIEKHFKVREACVGGIGFVLFGVDNENVTVQNSMGAINENDETLIKFDDGKKMKMKLSMIMQRNDLLKNQQFIESMGNILKNGITDKNELCRKKAFQLLEKLDNQINENLLEQISQKWDYIIIKKYNTFKRMQQRKHEKKKSLKRIKKKVKQKKKKKKVNENNNIKQICNENKHQEP